MDQAISYLKKLPFSEVKPGLTRILALLDAVDNPHKKLRSLHIAGTNGKGSVAAMLASVLQNAGYRTGLYTSPHLLSYRERIQINRSHISERVFLELTNKLMPIADSLVDTPTQFEFLTAMALLYLSQQKIDIAVIEVGMGGRFDATNVVTPLVGVLTNVELDHTEFLGPTVEKIAWEKAGIAKPNVPIVTGERKPEALAVIERECATVGASLIQAKMKIERRDFTWDYQEFDLPYHERLRLGLLGGYQHENLSVALETLSVLQAYLSLSNEAIRTGLERATWRGRFEIVQREPFVMIVDGAHNPHAARALRDDLRRYAEKFQIVNKLLLFGVFKDKDYHGVIQVLFPEFNEIFLVRPDSPRACEPSVLEIISQQLGINSSVSESVFIGLTRARRRAEALARESGSTLLCITGSLSLVGAVLQEMNEV